MGDIGIMDGFFLFMEYIITPLTTKFKFFAVADIFGDGQVLRGQQGIRPVQPSSWNRSQR